MTLADLKRALELLPPGTSVSLPREALLEALRELDSAPQADCQGTPERLLTAAQVAALLGTSRRWVYQHATQLGATRLSRRCVRFAEGIVQRRLARHR